MGPKRSLKLLTVSVPPELVRDLQATVHADGRNPSELFRVGVPPADTG